MGRPREFDRDEALEAAMQVFWRQGFLATSMHDLCDAMGIRSPSLYAAFGSKEGLYAEAVARYQATARRLIWDHLDGAPTVRAGMDKALRAAARILAGGGNPSGCLVTFAVGEGCPEVAADSARQSRQEGLALLLAGLRRARAAGELPRTANVEQLARFYLGVVQGMAVQGRDGATEQELAGLARAAMAAWPVPAPAPAGG